MPTPPRSRLLVAVVVMGSLLAVLTAGGPVFIGVEVLERSTGYRPDGIGLILPGLVATLLTAGAASAAAVVVLVATRAWSGAARGRLSAALAGLSLTLPVLVAVGTTAYWSFEGSAGSPGAWRDAVLVAAVLHASAVVLLLVASATRASRPRGALLLLALAALATAGVLEPRALTATFLAGSLAVAALVVAEAPRT